ncbi:gamma-glutamyl-gamma-aminobutyrate hydrolase family protein [Alkalihalobacillus oceani]|uniref:gamma-glutamyl-gamma-aminobutyrate hydrolase family protein n=1 Tax=Halalkalibacter oceani TaxID=1653776 RepID=UPI002040546E|nr:gamma-glutamyl-gamma-aminobutyrate hydrolase family protein [Halalkalibacter oceani]MCM3760964.1 gamma-glutamyl-gamma-aminobutyrate hydrolase family protein [Halalkalibacter oceani]
MTASAYPKPIIGISSSVIDHNAIPSVHVHQKYIEAVSEAGGIPLVIPLGSKEKIEAWVSICDGLILNGGEDVDPRSYGAQPDPALRKTKAARDETEIQLVKEAVKKKKPVFGICRGIAMMNAALGGTVLQDIETLHDQPINHYQKAARPEATHDVLIERNSRLYEYLKKEQVRVNSMHHQAIGKLAPTLKKVGQAKDGIIEAVQETEEAPSYLLGVQWHPEEMAKDDRLMKSLFEHFIEACHQPDRAAVSQ